MSDLKWDIRFMEMAKLTATWSKDPSTQIGAVIVGPNRNILSSGYNGFPRNIHDSNERYKNRDEKYKYVVHAEMNAIYNATYNGISLKGSTLYVYGLPICSECCKGFIQVGIRRIVITNKNLDNERWIDSWNFSKELLREAGIEYSILDEIK